LRDFVGYGQHPPHAAWPGGARVAISFVLNYEEGGERSILDGDDVTEPSLHEIVGYVAVDGARLLNVESMFEFGSRAGFWRVHRLFTERGLPLTVYAVGQALDRNPEAARAMGEAGWEVVGHGWRWIDYVELPEEVEREHIRRTNDTIERLTGTRPLGLYVGRTSERTRRIAAAEGLLYDSDSVADELPYWVDVEGKSHLVVPYTLDCNDYKFVLAGGFPDGESFYRYMRDTFEQLYDEGAETPRMMSVGLHARLVGRPGRARGLGRFLDEIAGRSDVWVATRLQIARHWADTHPPA
jgi:putative urate catabolism protein